MQKQISDNDIRAIRKWEKKLSADFPPGKIPLRLDGRKSNTEPHNILPATQEAAERYYLLLKSDPKAAEQVVDNLAEDMALYVFFQYANERFGLDYRPEWLMKLDRGEGLFTGKRKKR